MEDDTIVVTLDIPTEPQIEDEELEVQQVVLEEDVELVPPSKAELFFKSYLNMKKDNAYFKFGYHFLAFITFIVVGFQTPTQIALYPYLDIVCTIIYVLNFSLYIFDMIAKLNLYGFWNHEKAFLKNFWDVAQFSVALFLLLSAIFEVLEIFGIVFNPYIIYSFSRIPLAVNLMLLIPDYVNLDLGAVFTPMALSQLVKVLFFSVYFYIIFTLLGVQLISGANGVCMLSNTPFDGVGDMTLTTPLLHCNLYDSSIGYRCPMGFTCVDQRQYGINDGNLYFGDFFEGIMFVYQGSIQDGWSTQFIYSIQSCGILIATIYFVSLILFSAWLVRNVFVAVITQVLSEPLAYEPPKKEFNLRGANFGLSLFIENDLTELKDVGTKKVGDVNFTIYLKAILNSPFWNLFISALVITDTVLLATVGMIYVWQMILSAILFLEPILKMIAFGYKYFSPTDWIIYEFFMPTINMAAVILNTFNYYYLDIIYAIRVIKIISVHKIIWDYVVRILGSYARFATSMALAIIFLILLTSLSLQVFVGIPVIDGTTTVLEDFPNTFLIIFLIFLQGGAFNAMLNLGTLVSGGMFYFVILFFVGCHFFSNTIMMSIFITFILANLELTQEEIVAMQKEINVSFDPLDEYACGKIESQVVRLADVLTEGSVLPLRFKIYKFFPESPSPAKIPDQFRKNNLPAVKQKFMEVYLSEDYPTFEERLYVPEDFSQFPELPQKYFNCKNFGFSPNDFDQPFYELDQDTAFEMIKILNATISPLHTPTLKSLTRGVNKTSKMSSSKKEKNLDDGGELYVLNEKIDRVINLRDRIISYLREQHPFIDKSLFIFGRYNPIRVKLGIILNFRYNAKGSSSLENILASQTYFEWVMIILTLSSTCLMMLETADSMVFDQLYTTVIEYIYVSINMCELIIRIITQGLILTPSAIFNDASGILNVCTDVLGVIHLFYFINVSPTNKFINLNSYTSFAIFLRVARCLRPFRVVLLSNDLFRILSLIVSGWKNIAKILALLLILLLFFAYFGYYSFKGHLARCNDDTISNLTNCVDNFNSSLSNAPISTKNSAYNTTTFTVLVPRIEVQHSRFTFEDFFSAYLSAYIIMTLDSWDAGLDYIKSFVGDWITLYFYGYVFLANLIGVSMFVGVVIQAFNINTGDALLTGDQRSWSYLTQRIELTSPVFTPERPTNKARGLLYDFVMSFPYKLFHSLVIFVPSTLLLIYPLNDPNLRDEQFIGYNIILGCHCYFAFDMLLKLMSWGFFPFVKNTFNLIDFVVIVTGIVVSCLQLYTSYQDDIVLVYIFIATITVELILLSTRWDALKDLMLTFIMSLVKSLSAIVVMLIIMVVYALMGNVLFGRVKFGQVLDKYFNYRTSFNALFIMFIMATGDNWSAYLLDTAIEQPFCTYNSNLPVQSDCGGFLSSTIYFLTYLLIIQQIILNLFIATVLSNFSVFCASDEINGRFKPSDISSYILLWNKYDKRQESKISRGYARMLLLEYFNLKGFTSSKDYFKLAQLYHELDMTLKASYLNSDDKHLDNEDFKAHEKISFRGLMLLLATRLTNIEESFRTDLLLNRLRLEQEIEENVAIEIIIHWFFYYSSFKKEEDQTLGIDAKTIRLASDRTSGDQEFEEEDDAVNTLKLDPDSLKQEFDKINEEIKMEDVDQMDEFCSWWYEEFQLAQKRCIILN